MNKKDVTIIFLLYKTPHKLINSIKNYRKYKVCIFDQSNDHIIKKKIQKILPYIKYYKVSAINKGYAYGINHLVKHVKTKFFLCTQADVEIKLNSINKLKSTFKVKKDCIISLPIINNSKKKSNNIVETSLFYGGIFMSEKSKFLKIKSFDDNFFFYWEDVDLSERIKKSKYKIYTNLNSICSHTYGKSTNKSIKTFLIRNVNFKFGEYLFQYKHRKLKLIKCVREPFTYLIKSILFICTLRFKVGLNKFFNFIGIMKFFYFYIKKLI